MKPALLFIALLLALSLVFGELPIGDAAGCALLPLTIVTAFAGAFAVVVYAKGRARFAWALVILLLGAHISMGPLYYRGARIESRVVDDVGDPMAGVRVVALWETNRGSLFARVETRTDRAGYFVIPAWGPRLRPPLQWLDPAQPSIEAGTPPVVERDDSPNERVAAVSGEQWRRAEIVLPK